MLFGLNIYESYPLLSYHLRFFLLVFVSLPRCFTFLLGIKFNFIHFVLYPFISSIVFNQNFWSFWTVIEHTINPHIDIKLVEFAVTHRTAPISRSSMSEKQSFQANAWKMITVSSSNRNFDSFRSIRTSQIQFVCINLAVFTRVLFHPSLYRLFLNNLSVLKYLSLQLGLSYFCYYIHWKKIYFLLLKLIFACKFCFA